MHICIFAHGTQTRATTCLAGRGSGAHFCLGSSLAKLEAQVAIGSFVQRFPSARVVGEPEWNGRINLRGLEHLEVTFD